MAETNPLYPGLRTPPFIAPGLTDNSDDPGAPGAVAPPDVNPGMGAPPPSPTPPSPTPPPAAPPDPLQRQKDAYAQANKNYQDVVSQAPVAPKPKWWQMLGAVGAGAIVGAENAGGHSKHLIDPGPVEQGILAPGQALRDKQYQQKLSAAKASSDQALKELQEGGAAGKTQAETGELQQRGALYKQQADTLAAEGKMSPRNKYIAVAGGGLFDAEAGDWVKEPPGKISPDVLEVEPEKGKALGIKPTTDGRFLIPKEGIGPYLTNQVKPQQPTAEKNKEAFQTALSRLSAEGILAPQDLGDMTKVGQAILKSKFLSDDEKHGAIGYIGANVTPASTESAGIARALAYGQNRIQGLMDTTSGQLITMNADELNDANKKEPGRYVMAQQATPVMAKQAIFRSMHYTINNAMDKVNALSSFDAVTRAELANSMRDVDPSAGLRKFLQGSAATTMTQQQKEAVQALSLLSEDMMALRSVAGMGQGSDLMREAILKTIPSAATPDKEYAVSQLKQIEQLVGRLESGVPGLGSPSAGHSNTAQPAQTPAKAPPGAKPLADIIKF